MAANEQTLLRNLRRPHPPPWRGSKADFMITDKVRTKKVSAGEGNRQLLVGGIYHLGDRVRDETQPQQCGIRAEPRFFCAG